MLASEKSHRIISLDYYTKRYGLAYTKQADYFIPLQTCFENPESGAKMCAVLFLREKEKVATIQLLCAGLFDENIELKEEKTISHTELMYVFRHISNQYVLKKNPHVDDKSLEKIVSDLDTYNNNQYLSE